MLKKLLLLLSVLLFIPNTVLAQSLVDCSRTSVGFTPLIDMTASQFYPNSTNSSKEEGGLYEGGVNVLPMSHSHMQKALAATNEVKPRNASGVIDEANGKIGFASLGMSNTYQEFDDYMKRANGAGTLKSPKVILVNGAWYGQASLEWAVAPAPPNNPWDKLSDEVAAKGLDKKQVQVFWVKLTMKTPIYPRDNWPVFPQTMQDHLGVIVKKIKTDYPNTKMIYFSSRIYAGYSTATLSPEPSAYESAFAFKWIINDQIAGGGRTGVNYTNAPVMLWGHLGPNATTYLWADGERARSDGLIYKCEDFTDGVHPSGTGKTNVTNMLYNFFTQDALAKSWFTGSIIPTTTIPPTTQTPTPTTLPSVTPTPVPGDGNGDNKVDGLDYIIWQRKYGQNLSGVGNGDYDGNGIVNISDYVIWIGSLPR